MAQSSPRRAFAAPLTPCLEVHGDATWSASSSPIDETRQPLLPVNGEPRDDASKHTTRRRLLSIAIGISTIAGVVLVTALLVFSHRATEASASETAAKSTPSISRGSQDATFARRPPIVARPPVVGSLLEAVRDLPSPSNATSLELAAPIRIVSVLQGDGDATPVLLAKRASRLTRPR